MRVILIFSPLIILLIVFYLFLPWFSNNPIFTILLLLNGLFIYLAFGWPLHDGKHFKVNTHGVQKSWIYKGNDATYQLFSVTLISISMILFALYVLLIY